MKQAKHPITEGGYKAHQENEEKYHAALTDNGIKKVSQGIKNLSANLDYQIREEGGADWLPLGRGEFAALPTRLGDGGPQATLCASSVWRPRLSHRG